MNQILDHALEAFIDVLDQHTLADMASGQPPSAAAPDARRKRAATRRARTRMSRRAALLRRIACYDNAHGAPAMTV